MTTLAVDQPQLWQPFRDHWKLPSDITYLNHGSFGPSPLPVRQAYRQYQDQLEENPMDFFVRDLEPLHEQVKQKLGQFVGASENELALVDNATYAMNVVAYSFPLAAGDEVLLTNHEYGAVEQTWQRKCLQTGAKLRQVELPLPIPSSENAVENIVDRIEEAITPRTKIVIISHITSPTAVILPIAEICQMLRKRNVTSCIDGPHAIAMLPLYLNRLDCDLYCVSCHKWLCAGFGSGFLYVHPRNHSMIQPVVKSWGRLLPAVPQSWHEEFNWIGTCDPAAKLSIAPAIDFLQQVGLDNFRARTHYLARYAREQITAWTQFPAPVPDDNQWYGSMCTLPLPPGKADEFGGDDLREAFRQQANIEIPFIDWDEKRYIRVSCHLYNDETQIDQLLVALRKFLA